MSGGEELPRERLRARAEALHSFGRLRMRHMVARVMADNAMNVMLTLAITECDGLTSSEQGVVLINNLAPLPGLRSSMNLSKRDWSLPPAKCREDGRLG